MNLVEKILPSIGSGATESLGKTLLPNLYAEKNLSNVNSKKVDSLNHDPIVMSTSNNIDREKIFSDFFESARLGQYSKKNCDAFTQYYRFEKIPNPEAGFIYSQMYQKVDGKTVFRYGAIRSYDQLLDVITSTNIEHRTYNELIRENQSTKLVFDLEWCDFKINGNEFLKHPKELRVTTPQYEADKTLNEFKKYLFITANQVFGKPMTEDNLLVLKSSRQIHSDVTDRDYYKNSYHVHVMNYGYLPNLQHYHKQFSQILIDKTNENPILNNRLGISASQNEKLSHVVDISIYARNRNFRTVLSTKPKKNSYLMPEQKDYNQPICHFFMGWITDKDQKLDLSKLPKDTQISKSKKQSERTNCPSSSSNIGLEAPQHLQDHVAKILETLKPERVQEYGQWFDIMCRVKSTHTGLFKVFDQWSQKASNYDAKSIRTYWDNTYQSKYDYQSLLECSGIDNKQKTDPIDPINWLGTYDLTLEQLGLTLKNISGFDEDDMKKIKSTVKKIYSSINVAEPDPNKKKFLISQNIEKQLKTIKKLIKKIHIEKAHQLSSLKHTAYGYQWDYTYQGFPRDPLAEAKKNNYWGVTHRLNITDKYVQIDLKELVKELLSGTYDTIVIKAPCGSAKSDFLVKFLTLMTACGHLPHNFLLIEALRTLAYSLQERFMGLKKPYKWGDDDPNPNNVDLKLYTDLKTFNDLLDHNINIVINSLPKLADFGKDDQLDNYLRSLVAIDEWKSFLHNLCGGTLTGNRRKVVSHLEYYLKNIPFTVVMDQNIDDDCLQSLFYLRDPKKTLFYDYQMQTCCGQTIYELHDISKTLEILDKEYLSQKKLVYICCNSKTEGADMVYDYIKQKYPNYMMQIYTSDTPEDEKLNIGRCDEEWISIVIASPSVTYGVDYSKEGVFSATFCFISKGYSIPANMIVQQIRRVRHLIDKKIFICDESNSCWEKNTMKNIDEQLIERFNKVSKKVTKANLDIESQFIAELPQKFHQTQLPKYVLDDLKLNDETDVSGNKNACLKISQKKSKFVTDTKKIQESKKKIEIESMTIKSHLGPNGRPVLKNSWFAQVYRFYYRSELESMQNMTNWIRGYLCQQGFQYYVISSDQQQDEDLKKCIEQELILTKEARLKAQTKKYLEAPIQIESLNKLSEAKYYHCQLFGLKNIDEPFYQEWIDTKNYHKMSNLIQYLSSSVKQQRKQIQYNQSDYLLTEKNISACQLMDQLLEVCGIDLRGYFFTGMHTDKVEIVKLSPIQLTFIKQNQKDLLVYFGQVGRIRGQIKTTYHLNKLVARVLSSFLGIELECQQVLVKKKQQSIRDAEYSLEIPDEIYELLSYRVLANRQKTLQWLLSDVVCGQLRDKYQRICKKWKHLAICTKWPDCPEIDQIKIPKIQLKMKSNVTNTKETLNVYDPKVYPLTDKPYTPKMRIIPQIKIVEPKETLEEFLEKYKIGKGHSNFVELDPVQSKFALDRIQFNKV